MSLIAPRSERVRWTRNRHARSDRGAISDIDTLLRTLLELPPAFGFHPISNGALKVFHVLRPAELPALLLQVARGGHRGSRNGSLVETPLTIRQHIQWAGIIGRFFNDEL